MYTEFFLNNIYFNSDRYPKFYNEKYKCEMGDKKNYVISSLQMNISYLK